jgi:hypothetical protein
MRKVLAGLAAAGSLAIGMAATATTAQADWYGYDWNDGWHGDYYQPVDYGYGYGYLNNYAAPVGYSTIGMVAAPVQTVQTVTVRTIRPSRFSARRQVVTRTTVSQIAPRTLYDYAGPAPAANVAVPAYNNVAYYGGGYARPLYDYAGPAPAVASPVVQSVGYGRPLYDVATPVVQTVAMPVAAPYYRYTYLWDRTLVIDPATGFVVQTIWR